MRTKFVPPYMPAEDTVGGWNYKNYGEMFLDDDCCYPYYKYNYSQYNPLRLYWSNHYRAFKELYTELYHIGFVCTNQKEALNQVLRQPTKSIVFTYERYKDIHWKWKPKVYLQTNGRAKSNTQGVSSLDIPYWGKLKNDNAFWILINFIHKDLANQADKVMYMDLDKTNFGKAIKEAKEAKDEATKAADKANQVIKNLATQKKHHPTSSRGWLVLVGYNTLTSQTLDSKNFIVVGDDNKIYAESFRELDDDFYCPELDYPIFWKSLSKAKRQRSQLNRSSYGSTDIFNYDQFFQLKRLLNN